MHETKRRHHTTQEHETTRRHDTTALNDGNRNARQHHTKPWHENDGTKRHDGTKRNQTKRQHHTTARNQTTAPHDGNRNTRQHSTTAHTRHDSMKRHRTTQQHEMKRGRHNGNAHEQRRKAPRTTSTRAHAHENCRRTWMSASVHGSRVVGIEDQFDDERLRHRNTGAKMVMDGCSNGDRVDEVRVMQASTGGWHGAVLDCDLSGSWAFYVGHEKKISGLAKKSFRCC